jgi:nucleoside-diphosphate-sugar epimerase
MTAVVTGATGFCGAAMLRYLAGRGAEVIGLGRGDFFATDAAQPSATSLAKRFEKTPLDFVFHLAGTSHTPDLIALHQANVLTTVALFAALRMARQTPVVVLAGSAAEYGPVSPGDLPLQESRAEKPSDSYGVSKLIQTRIGHLAASEGHRVVLSRPFNIVGPGMPRRLAMGNFLAQMAAGQSAGHCEVVTANLQASRDFISIGDAVRAWHGLALNEEAQGKVVNVCSGRPVSVQQLVEWMVAAAPFPVTVRTPAAVPGAPGGEMHYGSVARLQHLLGWTPAPLTAETVRSITLQHLSAHA